MFNNKPKWGPVVVVGGSTKPAGRPHVKRGGEQMIVTSLLHYVA